MISKEEFEIAYRKFPPSLIESIYITYISVHSLRDNKLLAILLTLAALFPFLLEILFRLLHLSKRILIIPDYIYIFLLAAIGIISFTLWFKIRRRYNKIRKYLNISKEEYKKMVKMYYYNQYPTIKDFIMDKYLNNIKK
jgi:hypothetical protein